MASLLRRSRHCATFCWNQEGCPFFHCKPASCLFASKQRKIHSTSMPVTHCYPMPPSSVQPTLLPVSCHHLFSMSQRHLSSNSKHLLSIPHHHLLTIPFRRHLYSPSPFIAALVDTLPIQLVAGGLTLVHATLPVPWGLLVPLTAVAGKTCLVWSVVRLQNLSARRTMALALTESALNRRREQLSLLVQAGQMHPKDVKDHMAELKLQWTTEIVNKKSGPSFAAHFTAQFLIWSTITWAVGSCTGRFGQAGMSPGVTTEGLLWFSDLSLPDPYGVLPLLNCILLYGLLRFQFLSPVPTKEALSSKLPSNYWGLGYRCFASVLPLFLLFIGLKLPAAISLYWCTSTLFGYSHVLVLKRPTSFRQRLGVQPSPTDLPGNLSELARSFIRGRYVMSPVKDPEIVQEVVDTISARAKTLGMEIKLPSHLQSTKKS